MFVLGLVLAGGFSAHAQTAAERKVITKDYNQEQLKKLAAEFAEKNTKDKEEALRLAAANGWPLTYITEDGATAELVGLQDDGRPLYFQTLNVNAAFTSGINSLNTGGSLGLNLDGQNMLVALWDQDRPRATHNTFGGRLSILDAATNQADHSTHVMGTIMGSGLNSENGDGKGMASQATGNAYDWNNDTSEMASAAANGLLISNHSYGAIASQLSESSFGAYSSQSAAYDQVAFDAKNYLIIQAAGNDRATNQIHNPSKFGYDLVNNAKTAKNCLTVAAVYGLTAEYSGPEDVIIAPFSSYGPTDDNRIKPDIAAKGMQLLSSVSSGNSAYDIESGTSMASPVVSGGALLLQQRYRQLFPDYMRSATLRGLICHTADEAGDADGPDPRFGWGLFDAKKAVEAINNNGTSSYINQLSLSNSETFSINVIAQEGQKLQVSICWTDPAGAASSLLDNPSPRLKNDLDVRVTKGAATFYPWKLADTYEAPAVQGDNIVDNIERIDIPNASGQYTVTVSHKGSLTTGSQEYSLIVTSGVQTLDVDDVVANLFSVWPNPANASVNINLLDGSSEPASATFYDVQGREVMFTKLLGNTNLVDIQSLSKGIYMVKVAQGAQQQVKKIVVNK